MNRLNPLYVIALSFTIVFVSFFLLNTESKNYDLKTKEFNIIAVKAKEYKQFKASWNNKSFVNKTLNQILRSSTFKNQKVLRVNGKNSIKLKMISSNQKILNSFLNKLLNKKLIIKKLELNKSYIDLEIGLK
ncbi:hypothetical protein [Poseidonibacter lekithochrous]|uniref:hypothetical protein n=1 Tax=Poseidonibacter lekithochrous TaxID=1904463 RepID=UPI000D3572E7|nr:hypothetical protein [Poseidonibacter lekithochrous]